MILQGVERGDMRFGEPNSFLFQTLSHYAAPDREIPYLDVRSIGSRAQLWNQMTPKILHCRPCSKVVPLQFLPSQVLQNARLVQNLLGHVGCWPRRRRLTAVLIARGDGGGGGAPGHHGLPPDVRNAVARGKDGPVGVGARLQPGEIVGVIP